MERIEPELAESPLPVTSRPDAIEIDEGLVRALLRDQHPDLAGLPLRLAASGWDNEMWRVGNDLVVRLPRTPESALLTQEELRWLPALAHLPLPVPIPLRQGRATPSFPWPWYVTTWLTGAPANLTPVTDGAAATQLAGFLQALHLPAPPAAPPSYTLQDRVTEFERNLAAIRWRLADPEAIEGIFFAALAAPPWDGPALWVHSDLHPSNVLVADGRLAGVVDFGDLRVGDPAEDLGAAWALLPHDAIRGFFDAYGDVSDDMMLRARGRAAVMGVMLLGIGQAGERGLPGGQETWVGAGQTSIDRLLAR